MEAKQSEDETSESVQIQQNPSGHEEGIDEREELQGNDFDIRKLTKKDAVELLVRLKMNREEAESLQRWDRIYLLRETLRKMHELGELPDDLQKYLRA
jgi:hypothetical protein